MRRTLEDRLEGAATGAPIFRHTFTNMRAAWKYCYSTVRFFNNDHDDYQSTRHTRRSLRSEEEILASHEASGR